jgi:hypothetical protein
MSTGLALSVSGPSIFPDICKGNMASTIAYELPYSMSLSNNCTLDFKAPPDESNVTNTTRPPLGINHFTFKSITIETAISPVLATFGLEANFEIATRSSIASSTCKDPIKKAACLTMDISTSIALIASEPPTGPSIVNAVNGGFHGTWIEPLGLLNFAITNPSLGLAVQIYTSMQ